MALIIDGSSKKGYWKITSNSGIPNAYYVIQKDKILFESIAADGGVLRDLSGNNLINTGTDANTIDENGNALDTSEKIAQYLSDNR